MGPPWPAGLGYHSPALLELEKEHVFRNHWQIAGHVSDVPNAGDYLTIDVVGERALIVRGKDGVVRAFHNMCRHRGSRVVADSQGTCKNALVCPFHGWVYNLDGTLARRGPAALLPDLDKTEFGLMPLDLEIWMGFIFVRFRKRAAAFGGRTDEADRGRDRQLSHRRHGAVRGIWTQKSPVNWKSVRDVDNEGYHVAMAHPALQDLYGATYFDEPFVNGVSRSFATYNPHAGRRWSVQEVYQDRARPGAAAGAAAKAWLYYGMFPNSVLAVMPESVQFYQEFPLSTSETLLRGAIYRYPDETREQAAARYLAYRIDRDTMAEDVQLTIWSNESMLSEAFAASTCPISNTACAPTTIICAG